MADYQTLPEESYPNPEFERLLDNAFGADRKARGVYHLRSAPPHPDLCYGFYHADKLSALIRYWQIAVEENSSDDQSDAHRILLNFRFLLLGPLAVHPQRLNLGFGTKLIAYSLTAHKSLVLIMCLSRAHQIIIAVLIL